MHKGLILKNAAINSLIKLLLLIKDNKCIVNKSKVKEVTIDCDHCLRIGQKPNTVNLIWCSFMYCLTSNKDSKSESQLVRQVTTHSAADMCRSGNEKLNEILKFI